jgi:hypothetical protein
VDSTWFCSIGFRIVQADCLHADVNGLSRNTNVRDSKEVVLKR